MIKLEDVSYTYMKGGPFEKRALNSVSLNIGKGEFIGLIGHTGSGKSTLIQLLNGLIKPDSGKVTVDGDIITDKKTKLRDIRFKVGLVMQYPEYQLFEETVIKDISFGPLNMGCSSEEARNRAEFAASIVGISKELFEKSPFDLSGGQKRRVAIAGVLAMDPKVLILDEPTAGLDPAGRDEILCKIKDMHERMNLTVILVSHSMEDIARLADRIVVMNKGEVSMFDTPEKIFSNPEKLEEIGLAVPQVTMVVNKLSELGFPIKKGIYKEEDALHHIEKVLRGEAELC